MTHIAVLQQYFTDFADEMRSTTPLYAALSAQIANDPAVVELLLAQPKPADQIPVLLFAAVHDLVLAEPDLALAAHYPSVGGSFTGDLSQVYPVFKMLCRDRDDDLRATIATHTTQTNEVARCALLLPALARLAHAHGPVSLVDVGTSAGLNLQLDRYSYRYPPGGGCDPTEGPSPVVITAHQRGDTDVPVPPNPPVLAGRFGLDRHPIDVTDPAAARWLKACVWADQTERFARLAAAVELATKHQVELEVGDAVTNLAALVGRAGEMGYPVVINSWVLNYLDETARLAYLAELDRLGRERSLSWLVAESPRATSGLPWPQPISQPELTHVMQVDWVAGERRVMARAVAHPHAAWLQWLPS